MANNIQLYKLDIKSLKVEIEDISKYIYLHFQNSGLLFKWDEDYTDQLNTYAQELAKSGMSEDSVDMLKHKYIALIEDIADDINENVRNSMNFENTTDSENTYLTNEIIRDLLCKTIGHTNNNDDSAMQAWGAHYTPEGMIGRIVGTKKGVEAAKERLLYENIADQFSEDPGYRKDMESGYSKYFGNYSFHLIPEPEDLVIAKLEEELMLNTSAFNTIIQYTDAVEAKFNVDEIKSATKIEFAGDIEEIDFDNSFKDELECGWIHVNLYLLPDKITEKLNDEVVNNIKNSEQVVEKLENYIKDTYIQTMHEIYRGKEKIERKIHQYETSGKAPSTIRLCLTNVVGQNLKDIVTLDKDTFKKQIRIPCINELTEYLHEIDNNIAVGDALFIDNDYSVNSNKIYINLIGKNINEVEEKLESIIRKYHAKLLALIEDKINEMPEQITITINENDLKQMVYKILDNRYGGKGVAYSGQGSDYNTESKKWDVDEHETDEIVKRFTTNKIKIDTSKSMRILAADIVATYMDRCNIHAHVKLRR